MTSPDQPQPQPYQGPEGGGSLGGSLPPPPPPPPEPPQAGLPYPGEDFRPGEMARYSYHDHRDPQGTLRTQVIMVTHADATHVHGFVLAGERDLASFQRGQLTHGRQPPPAA